MNNVKSLLKVKIKMHRGAQTKKSNTLIDDSVRAHNCRPEAVNASVKRFSDVWVGDMKKAMNELYGMYQKLTFQWGETGWRCISTKNYLKLQNQVIQTNVIIESTIANIKNNWNLVVEDSKKLMGNLFNPDDFYSPDQVFCGVGVNIYSETMPNDNLDELKPLMGDIADEVIASQAEAANENFVDIQNQLLTRIVEKLETIKLRASEEDQNKKHYKSVLAQVEELCDDESFNITGNEKITEITSGIANLLEGIDGDDIRQNEFVREAVTEGSDQFINQLLELKI